MRSSANEREKEGEKKLSIPITVRQLEAVVRISESLAKMRLQPYATKTHVEEALRLFKVSTMSAVLSGNLAGKLKKFRLFSWIFEQRNIFFSGAEGFSSNEDHEKINRIEKQLKKRFAIGTQVSEKNIINDFVSVQKYPEQLVFKVIYAMIRRGELQHRIQRKMLYRLK